LLCLLFNVLFFFVWLGFFFFFFFVGGGGGGVRNISAFKLECLYGCLSEAIVTTARFVPKYGK